MHQTAGDSHCAQLKPGGALIGLKWDDVDDILLHPSQQAMLPVLARLVAQLHRCDSPSDYYEFQRELFNHVYDVESHLGGCSRVLKRLGSGKTIPADCPALPDGRDPSQIRDWELERYVYERLSRQLRTMGDGLAWRCFGYDRRAVLAFSRNQSPGPMYGKKGLPHELGSVENAWEDRGHFTLLHDLTNCLRIGDGTEFEGDQKATVHEWKRTPGKNPEQMRRIEKAINALMKGGDVSEETGTKFVQLDEPYRTDLAKLSDLLGLAREHGYRGMKLPPGRALLGTSLLEANEQWGGNLDQARAVFDSARRRALARAGINHASHHIRAVSADMAARIEVKPLVSTEVVYESPGHLRS